MVELVVQAQGDQECQSFVDVGTDHGILALGMALTGCFDKVIGVDASAEALEEGGLKLQQKLLDIHKPTVEQSLVDFRCGDGLTALEPKEADVVCIAGMGVVTMADILCSRKDPPPLLLDELQSSALVLQPTNTKPRNLCLLYQALHNIGWMPQQERIQYISGRWYITSLFYRQRSVQSVIHNNNDDNRQVEPIVPCSLVAQDDPATDKSESFTLLRQYVQHHRNWIQSNQKYSGNRPTEGEIHWHEYFNHF